MNPPICTKSMGLGASKFLNPACPRCRATVQFSRHSSAVPPPSSPVDRTRHDKGKEPPTITEVVGHSGRPYLIQQVLQEKESPTRRVYLARYAPAKLHYHHGLFSEFPIQRWGEKVHNKRCLPERIQVLPGHVPWFAQLSLYPPITRHDPRAVNVRLRLSDQRSLEPCSEKLTNCAYETNSPGCTTRPCGAARSKYCPYW